MRRIYLAILAGLVGLLFSAPSGLAQATNTFPDTGNVGIGTTNPTAGLEVGSGCAKIDFPNIGQIEVSTPLGKPGLVFWTGADYAENRFDIANTGDYFYLGYNASGPALVMQQGGNVGIGTTTPQTLLSMVSNSPTLSLIPRSGGYGRTSSIDMWGTFGYASNGDSATRRFAQIVVGSDSPGAWDTAHLAFMGITPDGGSPVELMRINTYTGNVGIGTNSPTNKLEVNGTIRAKEVIVEANNWPDYVFKPSYRLPSLTTWRQSITKTGHLPGMPSAADVQKKGVNMGDVQKALVKKVEELSLIVMRQEKRIDDLEAQLKSRNSNGGSN